MSPLMTVTALVAALCAIVFVIGLATRKWLLLLLGAPGPILICVWYLLASARPDPLVEFDRLFGGENRAYASEIQTVKPVFTNGFFISFHIGPANFETRIRPSFPSETDLQSPSFFLLGQRLPKGWPRFSPPRWRCIVRSMVTTSTCSISPTSSAPMRASAMTAGE